MTNTKQLIPLSMNDKILKILARFVADSFYLAAAITAAAIV
jgi:hypothetical protein